MLDRMIFTDSQTRQKVLNARMTRSPSSTASQLSGELSSDGTYELETTDLSRQVLFNRAALRFADSDRDALTREDFDGEWPSEAEREYVKQKGQHIRLMRDGIERRREDAAKRWQEHDRRLNDQEAIDESSERKEKALSGKGLVFEVEGTRPATPWPRVFEIVAERFEADTGKAVSHYTVKHIFETHKDRAIEFLEDLKSRKS